jgi:hypothetical protein
MQGGMNLRIPHLRLATVLATSLLLSACGYGGEFGVGYGVGFGVGPEPYPEPYGAAVAENDTVAFPDVVMHDFQLWPTGAPPSGTNLLPFALFPGEATHVADVYEDYYDADAFMSDGLFDYLEVWDAVFVSAFTDTVFFAY